jgi:hypothetical protein
VFFELRQYRIFPGKMAEWVRFMEETIIPKQTAVGYAIVGSFVGHGRYMRGRSRRSAYRPAM